MGYRKVINRMRKAKNFHAEKMQEMVIVGGVGNSVSDVSLHNVCVECHNVHVYVCNKLQRYINQLSKKAPKTCTTKTT